MISGHNLSPSTWRKFPKSRVQAEFRGLIIRIITKTPECAVAMKDLNLHLARSFLSAAIAKGMEERELVQRISDDLGDEGVHWKPRRVREFLEAALREGRCRRLSIRRAPDDQCSNLYYSDPFRAVRWLDANPNWAIQQAGGLSEALGVSKKVVNECRAGTSVYVVYDGTLAVMEPGLHLAEIFERCAVSLGLPTNWGAHVGDDDVFEDYCAKAGDLIEFCKDIIIKQTPITRQGFGTAPATKSGTETKDHVKEVAGMVESSPQDSEMQGTEITGSLLSHNKGGSAGAVPE